MNLGEVLDNPQSLDQWFGGGQLLSTVKLIDVSYLIRSRDASLVLGSRTLPVRTPRNWEAEWSISTIMLRIVSVNHFEINGRFPDRWLKLDCETSADRCAICISLGNEDSRLEIAGEIIRVMGFSGTSDEVDD